MCTFDRLAFAYGGGMYRGGSETFTKKALEFHESEYIYIFAEPQKPTPNKKINLIKILLKLFQFFILLFRFQNLSDTSNT